MGQQKGHVINSRFLFRSHDHVNLARREHGVAPIHHRCRRSKRMAWSTLSAEVQARADAEEELYFTRLQMAEFMGFLVKRE